MEKLLRSTLKNGQFEGLTLKRSRIMGSVKGAGNKSTETQLRCALIRSGVKGWKVRPKGALGNPDFLFPRAGVVVFVDGCFWHGCLKCGHIPKSNSVFWRAKIASTQRRDIRISRELRVRGLKVIRLWEHQIQNDVDACVGRIKKSL
jgi:DNA mismatch endonuclease (patch repair protein)